MALISLVVALGSLGYNTWRNELTEENRSVRLAALEVLKNLGELQVIVNFAFFAKNDQLGHPMAGWGRVALTSDLSMVLPEPAPERAEKLRQVWQRFSGITGGPSVPAGAQNRPTIGLREIGSVDDARVSRRTLTARGGGDRVGTGVAAWGALGRRPWAPPWGGGARPSRREGSAFGGGARGCSRRHSGCARIRPSETLATQLGKGRPIKPDLAPQGGLPQKIAPVI